MRASAVNPEAAPAAEEGISGHLGTTDAAKVFLAGAGIGFNPGSEEERLDRLRSARVGGSGRQAAPAVRARHAAAGGATCLRQKGDAEATAGIEGLRSYLVKERAEYKSS